MESPKHNALSDWLNEEIARLGPGMRLPTDTALAHRFGLCRLSVSKVVNKAAESGVLVRVRGAGTFRAPRMQSASPPQSRPDSIASLLNRIRSMLLNGEIRPGEALPTIKYLASRWRVSRTTVISAYRALAELGVVAKIGRTYWNASAHQTLCASGRGKEVILITDNERALHRVFSQGIFATPFRVAEDLLAANGFQMRYAYLNDLAGLAHSWQRGNSAVQGLLFHDVDESRFAYLAPLIRQIRAQVHASFPVVLHWAPIDIELKPRSFMHISQLGIMTALARCAAEFVVRGGFGALTVVLEQKHFYTETSGLFLLWDFLWLRSELKRVSSVVPFRIAVIRHKKESTLEGFLTTMNRATTAKVLGRYTPVSPDILGEEMFFVDSVQSIPVQRGQREIFFFQQDSEAVRFLERMTKERIGVPHEVSIVSMDNDPRLYHHGLSRCEVDWYSLGYLLAHAAIADIKIPRDGSGSIRVQARILGKRTTPLFANAN